MNEPGKHTVYIDVDDEITAIIDKVKTAPGKIVALVLPKRATVLQSIINMKLLKKSATAAKKNIVLITSEAGLLPLAHAVGVHVAATLQTKPQIPAMAGHDDPETDEISEALDEPEIDSAKTVGALAEGAKSATSDEDDETIELDDVNIEDDPSSTKKSKKKHKKGFKVPNFDRFRLSFFLIILAVIMLVVGWVMAAVVLPKATVVIVTDTSTTTSTIPFTANTAVQDLNVSQALVPAIQKEVKKTDTEKTTASGKKDNGTKASGTITIKNCEDSSSRTVAAGTTFLASGKSFVSTDTITVPAGTFSGGGTNCTTTTASGDVTAADNGDSYNLDAATYTTASSALAGNFRITGSAMAGGTSKLVTVVSQVDVDAAAAKMKGRQDDAAKKELGTQLQTAGLKSLDDTLVISAPAITSAPAVGAEASGDVIVTAVTTYNILGVKADYLSQLIKQDTSTKIDAAKQGILDDGLGAAVIRLDARKSATETQMSLQAIVVSGPQLNADSIKQEIKGKKRGDVENIIGKKTGVKDVTVSYSPFWVISTPKSAKKITITIQKPVVTKPKSNVSNP